MQTGSRSGGNVKEARFVAPGSDPPRQGRRKETQETREELLVSADMNITIQAVYEAFGRGDVATILDVCTDDVDWAAETVSTAAPWYGVRHGKEQVTAFFEAFGSAMEVDEFTPYAIAGNDDEVMSVVRFKSRARDNGRSSAMDLHHYFRFRDGKIAFYRGTEDTVQTEAVFRT